MDDMFKIWEQAIEKDLRDVTMELYGQDVASTVLQPTTSISPKHATDRGNAARGKAIARSN